ncbi:ATP-dependent nuclease [Lacrimispora brassicae]
MGIILTNIRVKNFRSIENIDLNLGKTNILIGQNNSGKSNLLKAVDLALGGYREISESDVFISADERLAHDKIAIIDILLKPLNSEGIIQKTFSDFWTSVFTDAWITTDETNGDFVGIRTTIQFDLRKNDYTILKKPVLEWNDCIDKAVVGNKKNFGNDMVDSITSFYMDAHRDAVEDIRNKKSYFGRATSQSDLSDELVTELEGQLNGINTEIVKNIPALQQTNQRMSSIGKTMGASASVVEIEPLARKISDLHKGMDIVYKDGTSAKFSISQHGMGTRSWISFLTLGAYVDWHIEKIKIDDEEAENYVMLTMEEPEAHLHPQAQRQLYSQIIGFNGQKIISTHSPSVVAQAEIGDIIHIEKANGKTQATHFNITKYTPEELNRIQREVINTRGELLFSNAIILCEGITEEQALPLYFKEYFGVEAICGGINIIGIGGQNYITFLNLIKDLKIPWFIFSDGESSAIKTVKKAVKAITDELIETLPNVVILDHGEDYERHLLASGYEEIIISAINECEENEEFFDNYVKTNNHQSCGRKPSGKPRCETCKQDIYEDVLRDYDGDGGKKRAVYDCCTGKRAKAKYASFVAQKIISQAEISRKIPPKVKVLFEEVSKVLDIVKKEEYRNDEVIS